MFPLTFMNSGEQSMGADRSSRNKTIRIGLEEGREYLARCISITSPLSAPDDFLDKTVIGDCLDVMPLLPRESVDLIIADPPYNLRKSYNGTVFQKKARDEYGQYTRQWLSEAVALLRDGGSMYICCDWESSLVIGNVLDEVLTVRNRITWQREKGRGAAANWKNGMEDIWFATKGDNYSFDLDAVKLRRRVVAPYRQDGVPKDWTELEHGSYRDTCPSNFWDDITVPFWSMAENTAHPTQKPEKLLAKLILASSKPGDIVFDPFSGSGSTCVTAKKLSRHYLGIEREPQYCIWAERRLEMAETDPTIQGYSDGHFYERNFFNK